MWLGVAVTVRHTGSPTTPKFIPVLIFIFISARSGQMASTHPRRAASR